MRYYELTENVTIHSGDKNSMYAAAYSILENCAPYLKEAGDNKLGMLRGMRLEQLKFDEKLIRTTDRTPTQMPKEWHDNLNMYFTGEFGAPFRNGMFCTGDPHIADFFGQRHYVFPIGDFKYIWSPEIFDLNPYLSDVTEMPELHSPTMAMNYASVEEYDKERAEWKAGEHAIEAIEGQYQDTGLSEAIPTGNEIMIYGKSYYAVHAEYAELVGFDKILEKVL